MRTFVITTLYLLLVIFIGMLAIFGMDMELARRDYVKAITDGNYEKPITGCLFETVCDTYTERLYKK